MKEIAMAVVVKAGKILIAQRKKSMKQGGLWEFPGGKIEPGETPEACIRREFMEELGIPVQVGDFLCDLDYTYSDVGALHFHVFRATCDMTEPAYLTAHEQVAWVSPKDMTNYPFCPADIPLIEFINKNCFSST